MARSPLLVYQEKSVDLSPAQYHMSSTRRPRFSSAVGALAGNALRAIALGKTERKKGKQGHSEIVFRS